MIKKLILGATCFGVGAVTAGVVTIGWVASPVWSDKLTGSIGRLLPPA